MCLISIAAMTQVPQAINYQAVARNNIGQALSNQAINVRLSIFQGATSLYSETRNVTTNALGLFNVKIGSAGATNVTGTFNLIDWASNTPETKLIKVELDVNNTNTFTDMGTQSLATVPFAFAAENAIKIGGFEVGTGEPNNHDLLQWNGSIWQPTAPSIAGAPISNTSPVTGDLLVYNGTSWVSKAGPKIVSFGGSIATIPFGGGGAPWVFAGPTTTITVVAGQFVSANSTGSFGHGNNIAQPCAVSVCWSEVAAGSPLTAFLDDTFPDATVSPSPEKTVLSVNGAKQFTTAGSYKVGLCLKNKSATINFGANDYSLNTIIIH